MGAGCVESLSRGWVCAMEEKSIDRGRTNLSIRPTVILPNSNTSIFDGRVLVDGGVQSFSKIGALLKHCQIGASNSSDRILVGLSIVELDENARLVVIVCDDSGFSGSVLVGFHGRFVGCLISSPGFRREGKRRGGRVERGVSRRGARQVGNLSRNRDGRMQHLCNKFVLDFSVRAALHRSAFPERGKPQSGIAI